MESSKAVPPSEDRQPQARHYAAMQKDNIIFKRYITQTAYYKVNS